MNILNTLLKLGDLEIARNSTLNHLRSEIYQSLPTHQRAALAYFFCRELAQAPAKPYPLPAGAAAYLSVDNPRLKDLRTAYASLNVAATVHSAWGDNLSEMDLQHFRSDNPYVWQERDNNFEINYALTAYYVKSIDTLGLFDKLKEDRLFGVSVHEMAGGKLISRDFLDAILEINFLTRTLGRPFFRNANIMDIGAGYGRFAHRLTTAFPEIAHVFCVDAVPESTFLCEYYLRFRNSAKTAVTIPLQDIIELLQNNPIQLATNIHSFSECTFKGITWWLDLLRKFKVRYLLVIPNRVEKGDDNIPPLLSREAVGTGRDFHKEILSRGYRLIRKEPKFLDPPAQKYGISPTGYYLFELAGTCY